MKKTVIIYGSSTGTCQNIAETIAAKLGIGTDNLFDASGIKAEKVNEFDNLLLGTSTWGDGELQDDNKQRKRRNETRGVGATNVKLLLKRSKK